MSKNTPFVIDVFLVGIFYHSNGKSNSDKKGLSPSQEQLQDKVSLLDKKEFGKGALNALQALMEINS